MYKVPQSLLECTLKYSKPLADDKSITEEQIARIQDLMAASYGLGIVAACCNDYVICNDSALATLKPENFTEPAWDVIQEGQKRELEFISDIMAAEIFH
jgi:hypothetical protein